MLALTGSGWKPQPSPDYRFRSMTLPALLVSIDDSAAEVLGRVLPTRGMAMDRSSDPETTIARIQQQRFDALIVDFDDPQMAKDVLQQAQKIGSAPLSVALVAD